LCPNVDCVLTKQKAAEKKAQEDTRKQQDLDAAIQFKVAQVIFLDEKNIFAETFFFAAENQPSHS
jgi:hypothetical protein